MSTTDDSPDREPVTLEQYVAEHFDSRHKNALEAIAGLDNRLSDTAALVLDILEAQEDDHS